MAENNVISEANYNYRLVELKKKFDVFHRTHECRYPLCGHEVRQQ